MNDVNALEKKIALVKSLTDICVARGAAKPLL